MRVLLVDDDPSTLTLLRLQLVRGDLDVSTAPDSTAALKALERAPFDWLLVDGQIAPLDGFQLSAKAKGLQPGLKIVMISGVYARPDIAGHPIQKFFQKPVDTGALAEYLRGR